MQPGDAARDVALASALAGLAVSAHSVLTILVVPGSRGSSGVDGGQYAGDSGARSTTWRPGA